MKTKVITWLGILLSAGLLYWLVTRFDLNAVQQALRVAHPGWLATGVLTYTTLFVLRGWRWALLLKPLKPIPIKTASEVFAIGFMAQNILPARLGDVARAYVLARRERIAASASFSTVMLERIFDGVTVVAFLNLVLWTFPPPCEGGVCPAWVGWVQGLATAIFIGAIVTCAIIAYNETLTLALARRLLSPVPENLRKRVIGLIERLGHGLHSLKSVKDTLMVSGLSLVIWLVEVVIYVFVAQAFQIETSFSTWMWVMAVLTLGIAVPSGPGYVAWFEGLIVQALALYGIAGPVALAFAVTMHLVHFIPGTLLGLLFTWTSGFRLKELSAAGRRSETDPQPA